MTSSLKAKTQPNFFYQKKKSEKMFSNDPCDLGFRNSRTVLNNSWKIKTSISSLDWFFFRRFATKISRDICTSSYSKAIRNIFVTRNRRNPHSVPSFAFRVEVTLFFTRRWEAERILSRDHRDFGPLLRSTKFHCVHVIEKTKKKRNKTRKEGKDRCAKGAEVKASLVTFVPRTDSGS